MQFTEFGLTVKYVPAPFASNLGNKAPTLTNFPATLIVQQCITHRTADFVFKIPNPVDPESDFVVTKVDLRGSPNVIFDQASLQIKQVQYVTKPTNETFQITVTDSQGAYT